MDGEPLLTINELDKELLRQSSPRLAEHCLHRGIVIIEGDYVCQHRVDVQSVIDDSGRWMTHL